MKCPLEIRENAVLLVDYAAGTLDPAAVAALNAHVAECPACRQQLAGQQAVWKAMDAWEAPEMSLDFDRRLYQRIETQSSWWQRMTAPLFRHVVPIAATAGVVLMAGLLLVRPGTPPAPPTESAQVTPAESIAPEQVQSALDDMSMLRDFNSLVRQDKSEPRM